MLSDLIIQLKLLLDVYLQEVDKLAGGDSMVEAVLVATTATLLSFMVIGLNRLTNFAYESIKRRYITKVTLNSNDYYERDAYISISEYLQSKSSQWGTRTYFISSVWDETINKTALKLTLGYGVHFMFIERKFMLIHIMERTEGTSAYNTMTIQYFGMSKKPIENLMSKVTKKKDGSKTQIFEFTNDEWTVSNEIKIQGLDSIALNPETLTEIKTMMDEFVNGESDCRHLGIAHKLTVILHGCPGSGKTSLIRAIAKEYGFNLCLMSTSLSNLAASMSKIPANSILVLEDFDSLSGTKARKGVKSSGEQLKGVPAESDNVQTTDQSTIADLWGDFADGDLSTFLNKLDGIVPLDGVPLFMTTNVIDKIDKAIVREGRTDFMLELPVLRPETVRDHFIAKYPDLETTYPNMEYPSLVGCMIYDIKKKSMMDTHRVAMYLDELHLEQSVPKLKVS